MSVTKKPIKSNHAPFIDNKFIFVNEYAAQLINEKPMKTYMHNMLNIDVDESMVFNSLLVPTVVTDHIENDTYVPFYDGVCVQQLNDMQEWAELNFINPFMYGLFFNFHIWKTVMSKITLPVNITNIKIPYDIYKASWENCSDNKNIELVSEVTYTTQDNTLEAMVYDLLSESEIPQAGEGGKFIHEAPSKVH